MKKVVKEVYKKYKKTPCFDNKAKDELVLKCLEELEEKLKDRTCMKCNVHKANVTRISNLNRKKQALIRHYQRKMKKIRDMLDYMIEHPYGQDTGTKTRKHKRDMRGTWKKK